MMIFYIQLIISFIAGGILIAIQTLLGERCTGFWRGVALTIPTTLALGLFFIGLTKTTADVAQAALVIPAALGADYAYVMIFALLSRFNIFISIVGSLFIFVAGGFAILIWPPANFTVSIFAYGMPFIVISYLIVRSLPQVTELKKFPMNALHIFIRSLIGGSIIALIVILANTLGNIWGGIFSAFPAAFTSTFIIYNRFQGKKVIPAIAKTLFFPGSIGFIIYGITAAFAFPIWGIWLGTFTAYAVTFLFFAGYAYVKSVLTGEKLFSKV